MTEEAKFIFIKLSNGDNLICTTLHDVSTIEKLKFLPIIDPIQIFSFKIPHNGVIIEKYIMQSWTPFSSDNTTKIPMSNVVFVGKLKEIFIDKYIEFITDPNSQQPIEEGGAEIAGTEDDEYDEDEEIEEMLEEVSKSQENRKKWYH
jgi:hypothetical protein